jgi:putative sterol carrier protein
MFSLVESVLGMLSGDILDKISTRTGIPKEKAEEALPEIVATITGALAKNASQKQGGQALSKAIAKDHDGSIWNNLADFIDNYQSGEGSAILRHVLGDETTAAEHNLSQKTGLDTGSIDSLFVMAAPLIMGMLGKIQKQESMHESKLLDLLRTEQGHKQAFAQKSSRILNKKMSDKTSRYPQSPKQKDVGVLDISEVKIPQDVFDIAEQRLLSDPEKFKGTSFRCQFDIEGINGGQWYILVDEKKKVVDKGVLENPICEAKINESDFLQLVLGRLNAPLALLTGKVKMKGDMGHIIKLVQTLLA